MVIAKEKTVALKVLTAAIKRKIRVSIRYRDQLSPRIVEPHAIYTDDHGELIADCYQVRGYSARGRPPPFWRPFRLKKITDPELLEESFSPRIMEGFNSGKQKYRFGLVAMVGEKTASFVFPQEERPEETGPFLPNGRRR